ncbi:MAG: hypothetical protein ACR2FS_13410 [Phormidesmis sp.]
MNFNQMSRAIFTIFAVVGLTIATASPVLAESGKQIKFAQAEVERVCDYYVNNREAFDACVTANLETGVEVHYLPSGDLGPSYTINVDFCELNTLEYLPDSPLADGNGYVNPCY